MPLGSAPVVSDRERAAPESPSTGDIAAAITTRIVGLLREHTGRGPTKAKAILSPDLVVVTLAECLTTAERRLAAAGESELVAHTRGLLHAGMRAEASAIVEELTGGRVIAYLTDQQHDPDLAIIVFFLAPTPLRVA